jgi:hypothetical protein
MAECLLAITDLASGRREFFEAGGGEGVLHDTMTAPGTFNGDEAVAELKAEDKRATRRG